MIIYWTMLLFPAFLYLFSKSGDKKKVTLTDTQSETFIQEKAPWIFAILIFGYFAYWTGLRTYFADTCTYIASYLLYSTDWEYGLTQIVWEGKAPGFDLFTLFFKCFISTEYQPYLMTIAIFSCVLLMITFRNYSIDIFYSSFMFVASLGVFWLMNGMRQFICVCIVFACTKLIYKGNFIKFFIIVYFASYIHATVLLMIPIYFVIRGSTWSWKTFLFVVGIVVVCIFAEPIFGSVDDIMGSGYSNATSQFAEDDGVNPLRVVFYLIPPALAFWCRKNLSKYYEQYPVLPVCVNASLATGALYFVGMFTSGILIGRLPIYCELYNLILMPFIFKYGFDEKDESTKKIVQYGFTAVLVAYFYMNTKGLFYVSDMTGYIY